MVIFIQSLISYSYSGCHGNHVVTQPAPHIRIRIHHIRTPETLRKTMVYNNLCYFFMTLDFRKKTTFGRAAATLIPVPVFV